MEGSPAQNFTKNTNGICRVVNPPTVKEEDTDETQHECADEETYLVSELTTENNLRIEIPSNFQYGYPVTEKILSNSEDCTSIPIIDSVMKVELEELTLPGKNEVPYFSKCTAQLKGNNHSVPNKVKTTTAMEEKNKPKLTFTKPNYKQRLRRRKLKTHPDLAPLLIQDGSFSKKVEGAYVCKQCGKNFISRSSHYMHAVKTHGKIRHCIICSIKFQYLFALRKHNLEVHDIGFECSTCGIKFSEKDRLRGHEPKCKRISKPVLPVLMKGVDRPRETSHRFQCPSCPESFVLYSFFAQHYRAKHASKKFRCSYCKDHWSTKEDVVKHQLECPLLPGGVTTEQPEKNASSSVIQKSRTATISPVQKDLIPKAKVEVRSESTSTCQVCHMKFLSKIALRNHVRFFHESLLSPLNTFNSSQTVSKTRFKVKESSFECHICNMKFLHSAQLREHLPTAHGSDSMEMKANVKTEII